MTFRIVLTMSVLALTVSAVDASAQPVPMRPGLWQLQMQNPELDEAMSKMREQLKSMPAQQRAMVEQMMAGRAMAGAGGGPGGTSVKTCITPEQAKRGLQAMKQRDGCEQTIRWKGRVGVVSMQCKDGTTGRGEITVASDRAYSGWMEVENPNQPRRPAQQKQPKHPKPQKRSMRMELSGKWTGADCQGIRSARSR